MLFGRYTCGFQWYIVLDGGPWPYPRKSGDLRVEPLSQNMQLQLSRSCYLATILSKSDSAFPKITLVLFVFIVLYRIDGVRKMFDELDQDKSGSVSLSEMKLTLHSLGLNDNEIEALVAQHDKNRDGELQFDEFVQFLWASWRVAPPPTNLSRISGVTRHVNWLDSLPFPQLFSFRPLFLSPLFLFFLLFSLFLFSLFS